MIRAVDNGFGNFRRVDRAFYSVFLVLVVSCLAPSRLYGPFRSTQWTADSGLPQNTVRGIVQTPDRYLWIATLNGIARFDGVRFTVFDKSNSPGMSSSRFMAMVGGEGDDLWAVSEDGNIVRYHEGVFRTLDTESGIRSHSATGITGDSRGGVWALSDERILHWNNASQSFEAESSEINQVKYVPLWWVGAGFWGREGRHLYC